MSVAILAADWPMPGKDIEDKGVDLSGIGLAGDVVGGVETDLGGHQPLELVDLGVVAVEEVEEGRLGAGDALDAARLEPPPLETQPLEIEDEILKPKGGAFAHRGRLRRLQVGHPETGLRRPALGEVGERGDDREQPGLHQRHGVAGDALLGVVADEAARGAEVENGLRRRGVLGVDMEVGHDVVPGLALDLGHPDDIGLGHLDVGAHLFQRLRRNVETELRFGLGEREPHPPPRRVAVAGGEKLEHLGRGIAPRQRVIESVDGCHGGSIAFVTRHSSLVTRCLLLVARDRSASASESASRPRPRPKQDASPA